MIATFENLLNELIRVGIQNNREFDKIEHPTLIGDMYEGLTRHILEAAILKDANVNIRNGKIRDSDGKYSGQIDCMVAVGDGTRIPHTDHYVYDIDDVIAVVEVKKTLNKQRLAEAQDSLRRVVDLRFRSRFSDVTATTANRIQRDAFRALLKRRYPKDEKFPIPDLSEVENAMYATIRASASLPLRVIWGYEGHKSEEGFRDTLSNVLKKGDIIEMAAWPDCIVSGPFVFAKSNGMPFGGDAPYVDAKLYAYTQRGLQVRTLLNLLWYRLCKRFDLDFMILADGRSFSVNPLVSYVNRNGRLSVEIHEIAEKALQTREVSPPPAIQLSVEEWATIVAAEQGSISVAELSKFEAHIKGLAADAEHLCKQVGLIKPEHLMWASPDELINQLTRSGLLILDGTELCLTTTRCQIFVNNEGIFACENRDGRFNSLFPPEFLAYLQKSQSYDYRRTQMFAVLELPKPG